MTTSRASDLNLLMVHADDHAPVQAGAAPAVLASGAVAARSTAAR